MNGFNVALMPINLWYTFLGCFMGTIIGVLPGIGPAAGIGLLIPVTFGMDPTSALIMMAGIYYGAMYGGSTTSILINTPGEASSVMTALDGYQMAKNGRAGAALAVSAIGSFIAGSLGIVALTVLAVPLAAVALKFGPAEYFCLMLFALAAVSSLTGKSIAKGIISTVLGLMIATIGIDLQSGQPRYTMGVPELQDGVGFLVVAGRHPRVKARVTIDDKTAALDLVDDGRLGGFAGPGSWTPPGPTIPPAHPRTKSLGPGAPDEHGAGVRDVDADRHLSRGRLAPHPRRACADRPRGLAEYADALPRRPDPEAGRQGRGRQGSPPRQALWQFETGQAAWRGEIDFATFRTRWASSPSPPSTRRRSGSSTYIFLG